MVKRFIIIKRKGSNKFLGAIPVRKGATILQLRELMKKKIRPGFVGKIITESQLKNILRRILPKKAKQLLMKKKRSKKKR